MFDDCIIKGLDILGKLVNPNNNICKTNHKPSIVLYFKTINKNNKPQPWQRWHYFATINDSNKQKVLNESKSLNHSFVNDNASVSTIS